MIAILDASHRDALSDLLIEAVTSGASVSFMHPVSREKADGFWDRALTAAARDERVILGAFEGEALMGTVTLLLDCPDNQPHRAEIAKMITRLSHRGRGIATALLREAEALAAQRDRTLLVLDTATDGGAARLYESVGYVLAGVIPDYAFKPHGGLSGTAFYWKRIGQAA
jgi:ribosomal protein S18 acetylase RimI-like enzyme